MGAVKKNYYSGLHLSVIIRSFSPNQQKKHSFRQPFNIFMEIIRGYLEDCKVRGLTHQTVLTYKNSVMEFLARNPDPTEVELKDLTYHLERLRGRNLQGSTLKGHFAAISSLYDYLIFIGKAQTNPILPFRRRFLARIKESFGGDNTRQLISIQQMCLLAGSAESTLDLTIIVLLAKTGIRRGELMALKISDLYFETGIIRLPDKAKRTNRIAFIDDELEAVLKRYLVWREQHATGDWLWVTKHGGRIHKDYAGRVIKSLAMKLGLHEPKGVLCRRLTPHCLRHFFTTHLFRAGMKEVYIEWLRGDSISGKSWKRYNRIDPERVRVEYLKCIPKILNSVQQGEISWSSQRDKKTENPINILKKRHF